MTYKPTKTILKNPTESSYMISGNKKVKIGFTDSVPADL